MHTKVQSKQQTSFYQVQSIDTKTEQEEKQKKQKFIQPSNQNNQFQNSIKFNQNSQRSNQNVNINEAIQLPSSMQPDQNSRFKNKDQQQEQDDKDDELKLLEIIKKFQKLIDQFNKNKKQNMFVVLLVGVTGSGKSTIFNFLSGAEFELNENQELKINDPQNIFSAMDGGMNSITKEPNFYHNKNNNHLIIDFPGFQDTNGVQDQLLFELLFHKIVTSGPIKVIYVIKNLESNLPNRGSDLQQFIKQLCEKGNINFQTFNLLLNCYLEDLSDTQLQEKITNDLRSVNKLQSIDKILVLRKAKNDNELQKIFTYKQLQILWQQIEQMQSTLIQPQKLPNSKMISDYLKNRILKTIEKYGKVLAQFFDQQYKRLSDQQSETTIPQMEKLLDLVKKVDEQQFFEWFTQYIQTCEQLANNLLIKDDIVTSSYNFIQIFKYYSQFSNLIEGYDDLKILKLIAKDQLKNMNDQISQRLQILKQTKQVNSITSEYEKGIQKQLQEIENYQQQITQLKVQKILDLQIINNLNNQLQDAQQYKKSLDEEKQKQIKQLEQQQKQFESNQRKFWQQHEQQINKLNQQHEQKIDQMYKQQQEIYEQQQELIKQVNDNYQQKINEMNQKNENKIEEHQATIKLLQQQFKDIESQQKKQNYSNEPYPKTRHQNLQARYGQQEINYNNISPFYDKQKFLCSIM